MELETIAAEAPVVTIDHPLMPIPPKDTPQQLSPTSEQKRRVRFPSDDVVTTYIDPPDLWPRDATAPSSQELLRHYIDACVRYNTRPLQKLTDQLLAIEIIAQRWAPALSLRGERLDPPQVESMEEILRWIRFRIFDISDTMLDDEGATALFDMLEFYDGVENLNVSGQKQLTERGWSACARLIRRAASLQALYIRHCTLDSQALRHIGRALQLGGFISEMHLERSSIGGAGLAHLVAGARSSSTLKRLHLSSCRLGPSDGTHLGILLRQSRSLECLDIEDNLLQDSGCMQVLSGLAANRESRLTDLRIGVNQLTAQAANAIAYALASSPLRYLSLTKNNIGTEGILAMRDGMLRCHLQHLDLSETRLSCEAAIAIAEIAVESRTLESLDLRGNAIRTAGIMALGLAARMNQRLISIDIDRSRPVGKNSSETANLEELVDLTLELDRQLTANRQSHALLLEQQQEINRALEENASNNANDTTTTALPDSESEKELNGVDHEHSEAQLSPNSVDNDPIQVFFGNGDVLYSDDEPTLDSNFINIPPKKENSSNIKSLNGDQVEDSPESQEPDRETTQKLPPNGEHGLSSDVIVNGDGNELSSNNHSSNNLEAPNVTSSADDVGTASGDNNSQPHTEEDFVKVSSSEIQAESSNNADENDEEGGIVMNNCAVNEPQQEQEQTEEVPSSAT